MKANVPTLMCAGKDYGHRISRHGLLGTVLGMDY